MKVQVSDAPKSQKVISVELPFETFAQAENLECERIAKDAVVPGFRPGKAPKDIVKKQNLHKIRSAALEKMIGDTIRDVLVGNNINPISKPDVTNVVLEDDKPVTFTVLVDIFPVVSVDNIKGFGFDKIKIKISEKDVDSTFSKMKDQYSEFAVPEKKRAVKDGDQVLMNYEGKIDGVVFEGGTAEKQNLLIGSGQFIPGFEEGVIGMKLDEIKDVELKFPDDYHQKDLAGKPAVFTVKLLEIKEKRTPEVNDEFAKKVNPKAESLEKLREMVLRDLQFEADQFAKMEAFNEILDKLVVENPFEVPMSVVYEQAERLAQQSMQQYHQMGINPEMFGITPQSIREQFVPNAEKQVKRAIFVNRIAETEQLNITEEDINKEVERIAEMTGYTVDDIRKELMSNQQAMPAMQNDLLADKVYLFLTGINTISEKEMSREEFEKIKMEEVAKQNAEPAEASEGEAEKKPKKRAAKKKTESAEATEGTEE